MRSILSISGKIKNRPDIWFFFGFLFAFPFNIRKVWFYFPIQGTFNEYTGIYVYMSDILFVAAILSWILVVLNNNKDYLSNIAIFKPKYDPKTCGQLPNSDLSTSSAAFFDIKQGIILLIIPFLIVLLSFVSISWSENKTVSIYRSIRLAELFLIYAYIIRSFIPYIVKYSDLFHVEQLQTIARYFKAILLGFIFIMFFDHYFWDIWQGQVLFWITCAFTSGLYCSTWNNYDRKTIGADIQTNRNIVPRGTITDIMKPFLIIMILIGIINSLAGILQVFLQHSLGLFQLKESLISPAIPGVAKIIVNSHSIIRAYGFMPHPNILGGFLLFSIITTLLYKQLFHVEQLQDPKQAKELISHISAIESSQKTSLSPNKTIVPRGTIAILKIIIILQTIALLLTVSKSAIIGLIVALFFINVPRGTFIKIAGICSAIIVTLFLLKVDLYSLFTKSLDERGLYLNVSRGTISEHPILGVGVGEFIDSFHKMLPNLPDWQYQPVHNVFLLVYNELGIFGFILFALFLLSLFRKERPKTNCSTWNN
ncbi:MAG: O-antigen ligase family protein [Candidatus Moranbacteria bacterium]|nr:O-antigen ligase family protein [Candidatus Moranbacteria bacterium]